MPQPPVNPDQPLIDRFLATMQARYGALGTRMWFDDANHRDSLMHQLDGYDQAEFPWATLGKPNMQTCTSMQKGDWLLFLYASGHATLWCRLRMKTLAFFSYSLQAANFRITRRAGCFPCLQIQATSAAEELPEE